MGVAKPIALIVEDDPDIREALEAVAVHAGFAPVAAAHGLEALRYLRAATDLPSVILLDLMMPIMDGWQFLDRREEAFRSIPVIVVTAKPDASLPDDVQLLQKPVSVEALVEAMRPHWR